MRIKHELVDLVLSVISVVNSFAGGWRGMVVALIVLGLLLASNWGEEPAPVTTADRLDVYGEFMAVCSEQYDREFCAEFWRDENYE